MGRETRRLTVILMPKEKQGIDKAGYSHKLKRIGKLWVGYVEVPKELVKELW